MSDDYRIGRRSVLRAGGAIVAGGLAGCTEIGDAPGGAEEEDEANDGEAAMGTERRERLVAAPGEVAIGDESWETWVYDDQYPGPEFRISEGDQLSIDVENRLPEGTTVHWHGVPLSNRMDGVPDVTQEPIAPDETFTYEFAARPAGSYLYHSHVGLQLDRGLLGPLIIEEADPHIEYDREYTLLLDDYLPEEPRPGSERQRGPGDGGPRDDGSRDGMGPGGGGGPGNGGGGPRGDMGPGAMHEVRPPYAGLLINGQPPTDPAVFEVEEGERVRLRFMNPSSSTTYLVAVGGHRLAITHADGRPVEPVTVDSFQISMGERYDALLEVDRPGTWAVVATPVDGDEPPAEAIVRYRGSDSEPDYPESSGQTLEYADLDAMETLNGLDGDSDRTFDLPLSHAGGRDGGWTIDGQVYPDADPLEIREGEHVRVRLVNHSPAIHPMHLHGHFFRVGDAIKDTVLVPPHMGQVTFDFLADNPGDWLFHCHNTYHMEAGMARVFRYVD